VTTDRFQEISVFVRVAQAGSFSAAARLLSLDPSTVSKMIARLEQRLGVPLFIRTSRVVRLTAEGQGFLESANRLLDDLDQAENTLKTQKDSPRGMLRVAAHPTITSMLLAPVIPEFMARHPDIRIDLSVWGWPASSLSTETVESDLDVVVLGGELSDSSMVARKVAVSRRIVCAAPAYLEKFGIPERPEELLNHNCLFGPVFQSHWPVNDRGKIRRLPVKGNFTSNYSELLRQLGVAGIGIVRLADFHARDDIAAGRLVPILREAEIADEEPINAIFQRHRGLIPRVKAFIDFLPGAIRPLIEADRFRPAQVAE
jgi:DNA-binding transcriptional LysR family regulator